MSSLKQQLRGQEKDLEEFKDINRRYRDQLIKVKVCSYHNGQICSSLMVYKMSDMANNDLEKYAKALDKYVMPGCTRADVHVGIVLS